MTSLGGLFRLLECRPSARAVMAEWRLRCGQDAMAAVAPLLRATGELTKTWPAAEESLPPLRVVRFRGRARAVCDEGLSPEVELDGLDQRVYELPVAALRSALCGALGLSAATAPVRSLLGAVRLGERDGLPVFLINGPDLDGAARDAVLASSGAPALAIAPTMDRWTEELRDRIERPGGVLASADALVEADGASWCATPSWHRVGGRLDRVATRTAAGSAAADDGPPPPRRLTELGRVWELRFAGLQAHVDSCVGLIYLRELLRFPGRRFTASGLFELAHPEAKSVPVPRGETAIDRAAAADYRDRLTNLDAEINRAGRHQDFTAKRIAEREREALVEQLQGATFRGRLKRASNGHKRVRDRVRVALVRALSEIREKHAPAGEHFSAHVRIGPEMSYDHQGPPAWEF